VNHFFRSVPGFASFRSIYAEMVEEASDGAYFVEVGSWLGKSAAFMAVEIANSGKRIRFDCVDSWSLPPKPDAVKYRNSAGNWRTHCTHRPKHDSMYDCFSAYIEPAREWVNPVKLASVEAAKLYDDASLDFVFIDANHHYRHVASDIAAWRHKVKPGGVLAGDDLTGFPGVRRAVVEAFGRRFQRLGRKGSYWFVRLR
jgi:SAM-dependent methyltransferase